ncbi:unnamed protein product, partial [Didymodactylos carnosus]
AVTRITQASDPIFGICSTSVGGDSQPASYGYGQCNYPPASTNVSDPSIPTDDESPMQILDSNFTTQYHNYGNNLETASSPNQGDTTGFYIIPSQTSTVLRAIQFGTARDFPEGDPLSITLEGSNSTNTTELILGRYWTLMYSGVTGLTTDPGRSVYGDLITLSNSTVPYNSYRVLITAQRGVSNGVQYSEVALYR